MNVRELLQVGKRFRASLPMPPVLRSALVAAVGIWGAYYLGAWLSRRVPIGNWFFFDLATIWFWNIYLSAACVSIGYVVVSRLLPRAERTRLETIALSFPTGVVIFVMGMYVGGFLALYGRVFAVVFPTLLLAVAARPVLAAWREARTAGTVPTLNLTALPLVFSIFGVLLVGLLYLGAMSPDAINYDATWLHMVIPQDYAHEGRIVAFPGDQVKNVPHLGAVLTTWSFLVPGLDMPALRWMMALHTEFTVFIWTLVGIAAGARWMARREARGTWVALALFPGIFVYDSNIAGASDHFLALFAVPMFLAANHVMRRFDRRAAILAGIIVGGALLSKFQALYLLVPLVICAVIRAGLLTVRRLRGARELPELAERPDLPELPTLATIAAAIGLTIGVAVLVLAPHLGSNWVFYDNPMYPLFADVFKHTHPSFAGAGAQTRAVIADWNFQPPADFVERYSKAFEMAFTFSFRPHYSFVNDLPVFGSTFTLLLPVLLVLKDAGRLRVAALIALATLVMWASSYWVDRNLQTFLPFLVAITAAILVRAWELGWIARAGLVALVTVQIAWAVPLYFSGTDRINGAIALLKAGMEGHARQHLAGYRSQFIALGESLPKNAVVALHNQHVMLGINRPVILDWAGFQTIIDYRQFKTPRDLYNRLHEIGVTHVIVPSTSRTAATVQEEVIFGVFAHFYGRTGQHFADMFVFPMPSPPPPVEAPYRVLAIGLPGYEDGLYAIDALSRNDQFPPSMRRQGPPLKTGSLAALISEANAVAIGNESAIDGPTREVINREFEQVAAPSGLRVVARHR